MNSPENVAGLWLRKVLEADWADELANDHSLGVVRVISIGEQAAKSDVR